MAERLNMSHLIHPQRCKFTFHIFVAGFTGGGGGVGVGGGANSNKLRSLPETWYGVTAWLKHARVCAEKS